MKIYNFEKQGMKFSFRNPKFKNDRLVMQYKIIGIAENKENDGYFYNSEFIPDKKAMRVYGVKIDNKDVLGVGLPEDILPEIMTMYEQLKAEQFNKRANSDVRYTLNDMTSYGIYNGVSRFDIEDIVKDVRNQHGSKVFIDTERIAKALTADEEIKKIAEETYVPYPINESWREEYKTVYKKNIENKTAPGYGIIPNEIIREKVTPFVLEEIGREKVKQTKAEEKEERRKQFNVVKVYTYQKPEGGEDGKDGYFDADITDGKETIRFVARNVFDFGFYTYPKRVEGTDDVFNNEILTEQERKVSKWLNEFSPFTTNIRM